MSNEPAPTPAAPALSPAIARALAQLQSDHAEFIDRFQAYATAVEVARDVFVAWERVEQFTGITDRDGREVTDDEVQEHFVELLMQLGRSLEAGGRGDCVRALQAGKEGPRLLAVELLQRAVADDRAMVAYLYARIRPAAPSGGGGARAYLNTTLRHEVLGTRPRVSVPPDWEGHLPENEIRTTNDIVAWIDQQLRFLSLSLSWPDQRTECKTLRDGHRLLAQLRIAHTLPFPLGVLTVAEQVAHLRKLQNVCLAAVEELGTAEDEDEPPPQPTSDFLATTELVEALGLGAEKKNTVDAALRRFAKQNRHCRDGTKSPRKGEVRVLYRVAMVWPFLLSKLSRWRASSVTGK